MSSEGDSDDSLRDELREMIGSEFDDASREEVSEALEEISDDLEEDSDLGDAGSTRTGTPALVRTSSGSYEPVGGSEADFLDSVSTAIQPFDLDREGAIPLITVSPRDDEALSRVFGQVLDVEAFWLEMEDPPELNEPVEVLLDIPSYGYERALPGRVVHRDEDRVAVALTGMTERDLEAIRDVFKRHQFRAHEKDTERDVSLDVDSSARGAPDVDVSQTWDGSADSSLALSRTFETVSDEESYWYGPRSPWLEPDAIGTGGEVRREADPEEVLLDISRQAFSGLLEFAAEDRRFQLQLEEGHVIEVSGRPYKEQEELGPMLRVADRVSEDELGEVSSYAIKEELRLQTALLELDIIPLEEIRRAVAGRLTYLLRMICDLGEGTAQLTPRDDLDSFPLPETEVRVHLPVESVIFRRRIDHFHSLDSDERDALIAEHRDEHPDVAPEAAGRIERAFADSAHRTLVSRMVDGSLCLEDVISESFLPPDETVSVLFALRSMDLVEFRSDPDESRALERFEDDLEVQHMSVHKASYFEVLNVHWSAYDDVVDEGYRERSEYFDPDDAPGDLPRKSQRRLEEISERIDAAYRVLKSRKSRHEYRQKIMPEYKLEHAVPLLMRRGRLAMRRGRPEVARDAFLRVVELEPGHDAATRELEAISEGEEAVEGA